VSVTEHEEHTGAGTTDEPPAAGITYASCTEGGYEILRYPLNHVHPITELVSLIPPRPTSMPSRATSPSSPSPTNTIPQCTTQRCTNSTRTATGRTSRSPATTS
jgi:hypothetical protein